MANIKPTIPNLNCPVQEPANDGYYTSKQSITNVSRLDRFLMVLDLPCSLKNILQKNNSCSTVALERLEMNIWGFVIPEFQVNINQVGYSGQVMNYSNHSRPALPPITVNFTIDNNFINYYILYKWLDLLNDDEKSVFDGKHLNPNSTGHLNDYSTTFTVYAVDEYEKRKAKWDFFYAFPSALGSINTAQREANEIETTLTFNAHYVKMNLL